MFQVLLPNNARIVWLKMFAVILLGTGYMAQAQNVFFVNLGSIKNDELDVQLTLEKLPTQSTLLFSFPSTIPGTYATEDYGRFIKNLKALDVNLKSLPVKKIGNNSFEISNATRLKYINYTVEDILDQKIKKNPIFGPAATNFVEGKNFIFNNAGLFGFFEGQEHEPIKIEIRKPENLYGNTSLPQTAVSAEKQSFLAASYHQLMDCPIMFSVPDTAQFFVGKTKVTIAVYDVQGIKRAKHFYEILKRDMQAVDDFLPDLPVDNYTFLVYVDDVHEFGDALAGKMGLLKKIRLARKAGGLSIGALEHGNSSTYYLGDFGTKFVIKELSVDEQLSDAAIHEFMHIITPLGLHSEHIGNFNYTKPIMSKHLWLYEGCTEYFAQLIKYKGGVYTPRQFLDEMETKLQTGLKFPVTQMSFTEMSANVLDKKYHEQYDQVYQRGAVLAMLLDAEIQHLSSGKQTLIDVLLALNKKYGAQKSFDENGFIDELVTMVHPDLKQFFDNYIEGKQQWRPNDQLQYVGVQYFDTLTEKTVLSPIKEKDNDVVFKTTMSGIARTVVKIGPNEWAGLKVGDEITINDYRETFEKTKNDLKEGDKTKLRIKRDNKMIDIEVPIKNGETKRYNCLRWRS